MNNSNNSLPHSQSHALTFTHARTHQIVTLERKKKIEVATCTHHITNTYKHTFAYTYPSFTLYCLFSGIISAKWQQQQQHQQQQESRTLLMRLPYVCSSQSRCQQCCDVFDDERRDAMWLVLAEHFCCRCLYVHLIGFHFFLVYSYLTRL